MLLRFRIMVAGKEAHRSGDGGALAEGPVEERVFEIDAASPEVRLGRQRGVEVELPFPSVSSVHARLVRGDLATEWTVEDLGSMNGSWLDGARLLPKRPSSLRAGQRLRLATVEMIFEGVVSAGAAEARVVPEGTATIARRLISDLFGAVGGEVPTVALEFAGHERGTLRLAEPGRRYLVGRSPSCDLVVASDHVSREHAALVRTEEGVLVSDLGSKNGVQVNGQSIAMAHRLADGDRLGVGVATLRFTDPEDRYLRHLESLASVSTPAQDSASSTAPPHSPEPGAAANSGPATGPRSDLAVGTPAAIAAGSGAPLLAIDVPPSVDATDEPLPVARSPLRWVAITLVIVTALVASAGLLTLLLSTR